MKLFLTALFLPILAGAAILPDTIGPFHRTATSKPELADRPLWDEYGLKDAETAAYENGPSKFTATAWRLQDSTACLAAFDWQRPPHSTPSKIANLAAETADALLVVHGNILLSFQGYKPSGAELAALGQSLLNVDTTTLPALAGYLPAQNLVPNSERYILGPVGLQKFDPGISPSVAAFHFGTEVQLGAFHSPKGDFA